jgi:DNA polymerase-3 subunit epsilon
MRQQIDLFADPITDTPLDRPAKRSVDKHSKWARALEATGQYRVLRQLTPRPIKQKCSSEGRKIGVIVDVETTGLDHGKDEIIELGMIAFTYRDTGRVLDVVDVFSELRQPSKPLSPEIVSLTGITDELVAGKAIDPAAAARFIEDASIVIAHNARFDRPFCESFVEQFSTKAWACSFSEVDWPGLGFEGAKLGYLLNHLGWFHCGHRAVEDCHALLEILDAPLPEGTGNVLQRLLDAAGRERHRIWAERSPFDFKDILKARGYRWNDGSDGRPKSWWIEIAEDKSPAELAFLRTEIYQRDVDIYVQKLSAFDRFKAPRSTA